MSTASSIISGADSPGTTPSAHTGRMAPVISEELWNKCGDRLGYISLDM